MENLLNLGFFSTRVGDDSELLGESIDSGGDGEEVVVDDKDDNSTSLVNLCMLSENE